MPTAPFGAVQFILIFVLVGIVFLLRRIHSRTEKRIIRYGIGGLMSAIIAVLCSYFIALIFTPFFSTDADYRYKFWAVFIGLSLILVMAGTLLSILITQIGESRESEETGKIDETE